VEKAVSKLKGIDRLLSRLGGTDPDARFRAEIVFGVGALLVLTLGLICVTELVWGTVAVGVISLVGLGAIVLVLFDLARSGRVARGAIWFMAIPFALSAILNFSSGGQTMGVSIALPSLVLIGAFVLPARAAIMLFAAVVLELVLVAAMNHAGGPFLINPDPAWSQGAIFRLPLLISVGTAFVGLLVRRAMNRHREELARTQKDLAANEKKLREIIEYSRGLICTHSLEGVVLSANPAAAQALGYEVGELLGVNIRELIPEEPRTHFDDYLARIRANGSESGALFLTARNGELRVWEYNNLLCRDADGVPYVLGNATDMTERRKLEEKLREQSIRDPLTGCFNRRYLSLAEERFGTGQNWGCIIVDLDNFKRINDTHGHRGGDEMLVAMGRFLNKHARTGDAVVRMGGDEFLLLLPTGGAVTDAVAERIRLAAGSDAPCDISIGFAAREGGELLERTIERADRQLYQIRIAERREDRRSPSGSD
jgi:diguanylate cyclase (GGDEF)-like protein/PAS domain S-box-containing protein